VEDFNTPLSPIVRSSKQKINKEILEQNNTINQADLTDVYRIYHPTKAQYTFFSAAHGTVSKIDLILGYKASLSNYKKITVTPCILSDQNELKLVLNNKNNSKKYANNWRLNNTLLKYQWVIKEMREEIKSFLEASENEDTTYQNLWDTPKSIQRGKFIPMNVYIKRTEKAQINDLNLHLKLLEKQGQAKPQISRAKINEIETKISYKESTK
jgi:hypothetical protein